MIQPYDQAHTYCVYRRATQIQIPQVPLFIEYLDFACISFYLNRIFRIIHLCLHYTII